MDGVHLKMIIARMLYYVILHSLDIRWDVKKAK